MNLSMDPRLGLGGQVMTLDIGSPSLSGASHVEA